MAKPEPRSQAMPMDRSILWNPSLPGARTSGRAPYPIFFQQEAIIALQEHLKASPTQAIFGFLIGSVYRDPETRVLYTVIDKTLKLNQAIYGDKTEVVVSRLWDRMQEQLAKASGALLGWYHSHPGQGGYLTAHDVETHEKFFTDPWQVAILVAAEAGGVTGRFFRAGQTADWHKTPLPFYELLQPESIKPDGKKRSFITWRNYKPYGPTLTGPKPKPAPPPEAAAPPPPPSPPPPPPPPPPPAEEEDIGEEVEEADEPLRIMRGSADDIPVIRTSADDEPAPAPPRKPPPPPRQSVKRPTAPVFIPDEPPVPPAPPPPPPLPPPPTQPRSPRGSAPDIPWQVAPEELPPPPFVPPPPPPPAAPPREPRRTPTHKFRLLEEETRQKPAPAAKPRRRKRRGRWLGRFALLLVLAGIGAGAYWYFKMRDPGTPPPWAGLVDRVKRLVSRGSPPPPPPPRTASRPAPRPAAPPAAAVAPVAPPNPFARFDRLSNDLSRAVRNFQDRAALFAAGRIDCTELANGLVTIENLWITYNTERRARISAFDPQRAANDQALYARVDSVESRFEASGCRRP